MTRPDIPARTEPYRASELLAVDGRALDAAFALFVCGQPGIADHRSDLFVWFRDEELGTYSEEPGRLWAACLAAEGRGRLPAGWTEERSARFNRWRRGSDTFESPQERRARAADFARDAIASVCAGLLPELSEDDLARQERNYRRGRRRGPRPPVVVGSCGVLPRPPESDRDKPPSLDRVVGFVIGVLLLLVVARFVVWAIGLP